MTLSGSSCLNGDGCVSTSSNKMPAKQRNIDESENEIDFSDKNLSSLEEIPRICKFVLDLVGFQLFKMLIAPFSLPIRRDHSLLQ